MKDLSPAEDYRFGFACRPCSLTHLETLFAPSVIWTIADDIRLAGHWITSCKSSAKRI